MPFYVTEPEPYRPEAIVWLDLSEGVVIGWQLIDPDAPPVSFAETLERVMRAPLVGPPRRPARIRVPDRQLAAELRQVVPEAEIVVAAVPEVHEVVRSIAESMPGGDAVGQSYFEDGRVPVAAVESLFAAAKVLYSVAPWKTAADTQVLRLDIPDLGVEGACVSIIGALGKSVGFIVFPSLVAFESFLDAMEQGGPKAGMPDLGTTTLALSFERGADLPAKMRREAAEHGWAVAGPNAYPQVQHRDRDGLPRPLDQHDVRIVAACASALAAFCIKHPALFDEEQFEPICESWLDENDLEVRFTVPYEAGNLFAINSAVSPVERPTAKIGRNAPCPCGSGRKYKKCCLPREQAGQSARAAPSRLHDVDWRLTEQMFRFGSRRFGKAWSDAAEARVDRERQPALFPSWALYHVPIDGKPLARWFTDEQGRSLSRTESSWLEAQQAAWLSVWEAIPHERLRDEKTGGWMIACWDEAVADLDERLSIPPRLANTDGEDLLLTVDRFEFDPADREEIERRVAALPGVEPPAPGEADRSYVFIRRSDATGSAWNNTVIGRAAVSKGKLRLESNSVQRADTLRRQVESACRGLLRHRGRNHSDPLSERVRGGYGAASMARGADEEASPAEALTMIRQFKAQHYSDWLDQPLPALGGKAPRDAVRTKAGKAAVNALLKDMEHHEGRLPREQQFDFSPLRRELDLKDGDEGRTT